LETTIQTPNDILDLMKDIKYDNFTDETKYIIKSPEELLKTKSGICYDQVELERQYFSKLNYEFKTFFAYEKLPLDDNRTHTFLIYKENNKYYWFEHSWGPYKGIHGGFSSYEECLSYITKELKRSGWKTVNAFEYKKPQIKKANINEFSRYIYDTSRNR
jgi:hypothetical protein